MRTAPMTRQVLICVFVFTALAGGAWLPASAQTPAVTAAQPVAKAPAAPAAPVGIPRWARVSFFGQGATTSTPGEASTSFSEIVGTFAAESARRPDGGLQYGVNLRFSSFPSSSDRDRRVSIYDAYVAQIFSGGRFSVKGGQMWLTDFGGLGAVAGGAVEVRQTGTSKGLHWRAGGFGGVEPEILDIGYVPGIKKFGGYLALDGNGAHKHVVGYVAVRNQNLTERSVLTFTNFVPAGQRFFLYQAAEVDLAGPGGQGSGGLSYFFVNANGSPASAVDLQFTYHRGRSLDARTITDDIINGRPVPAKALDGFLYESIGGRVTVRVLKNLRVYGGYGQDKNDRDADPTGRISFGASASNLVGTGIDLTVSDYRYSTGSSSSYDSWYVSAGRSLGTKVYLSGDFNTSLSVLRFIRFDGLLIENRPETKRYGVSAVVNLNRRVSLLVNGDYTQDTSFSETRFLAGLVYRF